MLETNHNYRSKSSLTSLDSSELSSIRGGELIDPEGSAKLAAIGGMIGGPVGAVAGYLFPTALVIGEGYLRERLKNIPLDPC